MTAALFAHAAGASVIILEADDKLGGEPGIYNHRSANMDSGLLEALGPEMTKDERMRT